jgi:peptidoglycan/xylan/chitin deacetylase (PgdA/CDA1 family)
MVGVTIAAASHKSDDVQWNKGSGPAQMAKGLPNPPGWYRAAVGPRSREKVLYLTFDDGPSAHTASLLKALGRYDAKATFFVTGNAGMHKAQVRRMARNGHAIGNHTYNHLRLTQYPTTRVRSQLQAVKRLVGPAIAPCMRPPYGMINARVATAAIRLGFQPVMWTAHIEDWQPHSLRWTIDRLRQDTAPGAVILMHDTHAQTVAAVKALLPRWDARGYRLEVVPACA